MTNLRIKFVFESDGGNNLWLDDINLNGASVGIAESGERGGGLFVVPNPATDHMVVSTWLADGGAVNVELLDLLGRPVRMVDQGVHPPGSAKWSVDLSGLPAGMYLVRMQRSGGVQMARFTKE